jgi:uncharacterized protein YdaU (DUF1376 family)
VNYYERHLGDYARDTAHLSLLEHGVYTLLLDRYYATEAGIPAEEAHRLARARSKEEREAVDVVLREFFTLEAGVYRQKRCDAEIDRARVRIEAARQNGRSGGRPRKADPQTDQQPAGFSSANPSQTQQKPDGFSLGSDSETQPKALHAPGSRAPGSRSQSPISNSQASDHSEAQSESDETQSVTRLAEVRSRIGDFDEKSAPSKSPARESKKPQNALEFEQINDRVERLLVDLDREGSPVNLHDYSQIANLAGLTASQVRTSIKQLTDRKRLPIAPRQRARA